MFLLKSSMMKENKISKELISNMAIKTVSDSDDNELPKEFTRFDYPMFAMPQYIVNIIVFVIAHVAFIYNTFFLAPSLKLPWKGPVLASIIFGYIGGLGITVGAHRYWTHKSFKANKRLQILLMLMQTLAFQYPIFKWCRDHRVHHKYMDTNADPHNSTRGFWFSHITWLLSPKHPDVEKSFKIIDISDLANDPIVRFQSRYYEILIAIVYFGIPMTILHFLFPYLTLFQLLLLNLSRWPFSTHISALVNSAAHIWGDKPYDKNITATDNKLISMFAVGEGWHNYHHTFPWDYKAAEFGYRFNLSTLFIHFFVFIGWAWDLKTVSQQLLVDRINRTGSKNHPLHHKSYYNNAVTHSYSQRHTTACWGWGDKEITEEDKQITETLFSLKDH